MRIRMNLVYVTPLHVTAPSGDLVEMRSVTLHPAEPGQAEVRILTDDIKAADALDVGSEVYLDIVNV